MSVQTTASDDADRRVTPEVDVIGDRQHLAALMTEVRELLRADTAVLLAVDQTGDQLEPIVTVGLGRAYRAAMRIPIGRGFAGLIAATRSPVTIADLSTADIVNPVLRRSGLQSVLGAPLLIGDELVGVVHVGSRSHRAFSEEDELLLSRSADRVARAIQDRRAAEEHTAALILQRSLVPAVLPKLPELEFAARYLPADGDFGGDWYDVFMLADGSVGIVMGDVAGHGLTASVIMGRLRSALRAYALDYSDPAEVLSHLDRKLIHFEQGALATVLYAVIAPPFDQMLISSAGHLLPVLAGAGAVGRQLEIMVDPPLGVGQGRERHATSVPLARGDVVCAFTDGLVERRPHAGEVFLDIDMYIQAIAESIHDDEPEAICSQVLARVLPDDAEDDIALLVLKRMGSATISN